MLPESIKKLLRPDHSNGRVRLLVLIAMVLGTVRLFETPPLQSANDRSRWATVYSLVHHGTFAIDEVRKFPGWDSIDKVKLTGKDGEDHFYSSKPPLFATVVAGGYWLIKSTLGWTINPANLDSVTPISRLLLFLINIVPTAFALGSFSKIVTRHVEISFTRNFLVAAACFGTLWSAFLPSLNNHTPALCCVMFALRAAIVSLPANLTLQRAAAAGLAAGLAVTFELPALAFLGGLFVILLKVAPRRTIVGFVPLAVLPLAAGLIANRIAIEQWTPAYASYNEPDSPYKYVDRGVPSYWSDPRGLDRNADSLYPYLFHCTLGHHGILSLTPIFLLSIVGLLRFSKWQHSPLAVYNLLGALLTIIVLGFYLSRTENRNYGGVSVGLRWMLWLIPFWLLQMASAVDLLSLNRVGQAILLVFLAPSVFSAWHPFNAPWKQPWIFQAMDARNLLPQYRDATPAFEVPRRTWISQFASSDEVDPDYWIEFSGAAIDGSAITLRVADGGPVTVDGRVGRRVEFVWNAGRPTESRQSLVFDSRALQEGDPSEVLLVDSGTSASDQRVSALELVCGVPVAVDPNSGALVLPAYTNATRRYQFLPVREDAFRTDVGVAWGARRTTSPGVPYVQIRSECWNTAELPFGVGLWDLQTTHGETGAMLAKRRLSAVRTGKFLALPAPPPAE